MTKIQRIAIHHLSFLYGNGGPKYTRGNHDFLKRLLAEESDVLRYQPTQECQDAASAVESENWDGLPVKVRRVVVLEITKKEYWQRVVGELSDFDEEKESS